jgi:hypothetical protein
LWILEGNSQTLSEFHLIRHGFVKTPPTKKMPKEKKVMAPRGDATMQCAEYLGKQRLPLPVTLQGLTISPSQSSGAVNSGGP